MKGCRLYDPITNKLLTSRDVVFDENCARNWESLQSGQILEDGEFLNSPIRQENENGGSGSSTQSSSQSLVSNSSLSSLSSS